MERPRVRIVCLVPSLTETLASWNLDPIACTRFCERSDLPHVGGTKDPDLARIVELAPDLVLVDTEENRREDHDELVRSGIAVHATSIRSLTDVSTQLGALAEQLGVRWRPPTLRAPRATRLHAFVPIWRRPWIALGAPTYATSLLAHLGVANVVVDRGPYPAVELDEVRARDPDVVLAPSEPYPFTARQLPELASVARTVFVDGKDLFWWGVRTPLALERLGGALGEP